LLPYYFADALKKAPQLGHLNRPTVTGFLPFGASVQVFSGFATSVPHFEHFAIYNTLSPYTMRGFKRLA